MSFFDEFINWVKKDNNAVQIIGFVVTIVIAFITAHFTAKREKSKSTTEYFKQHGIKEQIEMLDFWSGILLNDFSTAVNKIREIDKNFKNYNETEIMKIVIQKSFSYSSKATTKAIADYMHYIYTPNKDRKTTKKIPMVQLVLVARIIRLMKYDFTGERTSVIDAFKLKLNDLNLRKTLVIRAILVYYKLKHCCPYLLLILVVVIALLVIA